MQTTNQVTIKFHDAEDIPSADDRQWWVDRQNADCPFSRFIGNDKAVEILADAAFVALADTHHICNRQYFALFGPSSTGKTTLAGLFAETVGLPFVEIHPKAVASLSDILSKINDVLKATRVDEYTLELVAYTDPARRNYLRIPPCVVFLDEVHLLNNQLMQGLLKATDRSNPILDTGKWVADCGAVCWMIATTDRGMVFDAFDTRFTKINLGLYSKDEMAQIIHVHNPGWDENICKLVAHYASHVPREALAFAEQMKISMERHGGTWEEVAKRIAQRNDIDEHGMTKQRVNLLSILGQKPTGKDRLATMLAVRSEELDRFIVPPLLLRTEDSPEKVSVCSKGYVITEAGLAELDKRGIPNMGTDALEQPSRRKAI